MMFRHFVENKRYQDFDFDVESAMIRMKKLGYTDAHFYGKSMKYEAFCKFVKYVEHDIEFIYLYPDGSVLKGYVEHDFIDFIYLYPDGSVLKGTCPAWEDEEESETKALSRDELKEINTIFKSIKWCPWEGVEDHVEDS